MKSLILMSFLIISTLFIISCADTSNNETSCVKIGCSDTEKICNEANGKCEYPKRCTETGCETDYICNETTGLCELPTNCLETGCGLTQYCDPIEKECKDNCYDGKCLANESCNNQTGLCNPDCSKVTCQENFKCDPTDALCKAECLSQGYCEVTEDCNETTGLCDLNCPENKCAANERCVPLTGECEIDCSQVVCQENSQLCDPQDGVCKAICEVNKCEEYQNCNQTTGLCEETILSQYQNECTDETDCLSGICIQVGESKQCSLTCDLIESCGENWDCFPNDDESICAPIINNSCEICVDDTDCSDFGGKCIELDGVKSCLDSCEYSNNCATGFTCSETDIDGDIFKLCSPDGNSCDCNSNSINLTLSCDITNGFGTCRGSKTCTETGWSECTGNEPIEEICDNKDNNCDGIIDNTPITTCLNNNNIGTCSGNLICQNGVEICDAKTPTIESCNGIDDNCNNEVDELDDLACRKTNEIGSCSGFQICGGDLGWNECNALEPSIEVCDGIDNDCNDSLDDNLDGSCEITNEFGTCSGLRTCLGEAGWDDCNANIPSLEVCDGIDNNCNNSLDEANEHLFDSCSEIENAELSCVNGNCNLVSCLENYYNLDEDNSNGCEYHCTYISFQDLPDGVDQNCDGIDGSILSAFFVSTRIGSDDNNGSMETPFKTIEHAINRSQILGKTQILVAAGDYNENFSLVNGVSIFGGYEDTNWQRDFDTNISKIVTSANGIACLNITQETFVDGFTINSANANIYPQNSIVLNVSGSGNNLKLQNLILNAGNGMKGLDGVNGVKGNNGGNGADGANGSANDNDGAGAGGAGGVNTSCPAANGGKGGKGGDEDHNSDYDAYPGSSSASGILGGSAGSGGDPGTKGGDGKSDTTSGASGANGLGGSPEGQIIGNQWIGFAGNSGNTGSFGAGGGGGGGGGGQQCFFCDNGGGNGGGGGSAGGCGGTGATGGQPGTGSFGVFLNNSTPTITNVHINAGFGGNGGNAGVGGDGGNPGTTGKGATASTSDIGAGGDGGLGKPGGSGGAGGGGAGGISYCIYKVNSTPTLDSWTCQTSLGGSGGTSLGHNGSTGNSGDIY